MTDEQFQLELRRRARSKLAYIHGTKPHPKEEGKILHCHVAGTIVSAEKKFLYVVVLSSIVHHNAVFHVVLPDGSETHLTSKDFSKPVVPGAVFLDSISNAQPPLTMMSTKFLPSNLGVMFHCSNKSMYVTSTLIISISQEGKLSIQMKSSSHIPVVPPQTLVMVYLCLM